MAKRRPTPQRVAAFMTTLFDRRGELSHAEAVRQIRAEFGRAFVRPSASGGGAIDRRVRSEFRKLTPDKTWSRTGGRWIPRPRPAAPWLGLPRA